jgi:hypothetical protein
MFQLGRQVEDAKEDLIDLQHADAYNRITTQIAWVDIHKPEDRDTYKAYKTVVDPEEPGFPSYHRAYSAHGPSSTSKRCFKCDLWGHIRRDCPAIIRRPAKKSKKSSRKSRL